MFIGLGTQLIFSFHRLKMLKKYPKPLIRASNPFVVGFKVILAFELAVFGGSYYVWRKLCNQQGKCNLFALSYNDSYMHFVVFDNLLFVFNNTVHEFSFEIFF